MNRFLPLLLAAAGCSSSDGRTALSGTVTYAGKPVVYGTVMFEPDAAKGHTGPQGAGEIHDGRFVTNPGYGPVAGPHVVRVTGWDVRPGDGMLPPPVVANWTTTIEISTGGGTFDFAIPPQPPPPPKPRPAKK